MIVEDISVGKLDLQIKCFFSTSTLTPERWTRSHETPGRQLGRRTRTTAGPAQLGAIVLEFLAARAEELAVLGVPYICYSGKCLTFSPPELRAHIFNTCIVYLLHFTFYYNIETWLSARVTASQWWSSNHASDWRVQVLGERPVEVDVADAGPEAFSWTTIRMTSNDHDSYKNCCEEEHSCFSYVRREVFHTRCFSFCLNPKQI